MTSKNSKSDTSDLEALRKEAEYYRNLIKQHESKQILSMKSNQSSTKAYTSTNYYNKSSSAGNSFPCSSKSKNVMYSGQPAVKTKYTYNRTVFNHPKASINRLVIPGSSNTVASIPVNSRYNFIKKNPSIKPANSFSITNLPKKQPSTHFLSNLKSSESISPKSTASSAQAKKDLLQLKQSNLSSKVLMSEIIAMTKRLKDASRAMAPKPKTSVNVLCSRTVPSPQASLPRKIFINPLFAKNNSTSINQISSTISSSTPKGLFKKGIEINPRKILQNCPNISKSLVATKTPITPKTPVSTVKASFSQNPIQRVLCMKTPLDKNASAVRAVSTKKAATRLVSSKFKLVNKKSTVSVKPTTMKQVDSSHKLPLTNSLATNKGKPKLVNSKYKIVNKKSPVALKRNSLKFVSPKSPKIKKNVIYKNQIYKINKLVPPVKANTNRYSKSFKMVKPTSRTPKSLSSSLKRSKYKIVNGASISKPAKKQKVVKIGSSGKVLNLSSDMDVDLLMELAAEKKSQSVATPKPRKFLLKRVFKTKNMLVNKNVFSPQVKTAQMIKSKYFATTRKHVWLKEARPRKIVNSYLSGALKRHQSKFFSSAFHQRQRYSVKSRKYTSALYSKNHKRNQYAYRISNYASPKSFKRMSGSHSVYRKISHSKYSPTTPVSKILASRVLQHSISRALTASSKKTSKANTYCMFYNRFGRCNKGTQCMYKHDPSKIAICTRFVRGTCKKESCPFSHEISPGKMAICSFYLTESCTKTNCPYRHEKLKPGAELCKAFVKGYCPKGKECQKAHVLICPDYVQGSCSKGDACAFPHPPQREKKANCEKAPEKLEEKDSDELLMERVSRYFEPSKGEQQSQDRYSSNLVVPQRITLPEQPSFISLSLSDNES